MFDTPSPRVYSIDSDDHFLDVLARKLLKICRGDQYALSDMRVLLPTRRAGRALTEAFLRLSGGVPQLLPRLMPLGDIDEDELSIAEAATTPLGSGLDTSPAISGITRQILLARAIMAMPSHRLQVSQATALAAELAKLIDRLATEDCDPKQLSDLVTDDFAAHWQEVLKFLEILIDQWPKILSVEGAVDPAVRRNVLLRAQATFWQDQPPKTPVIAAGSTGSIPATAALLKVVAGLPNGAVILPGLDMRLDEEAWGLLAPSHPQYGLKQLLDRLQVARGDVRVLRDSGPQVNRQRNRILSLALRPPSAPEIDLPSTTDLHRDLKHAARVDCPGPSEEANVIALIMRHTLEAPGKTCALVTPDRSLARRVSAALKRWNIVVDDSAGRPLSTTPPGSFLRLVVEAARERLAPVALLALLKHPLCAGGIPTGEFRALVRAFEYSVLRGPRPAPGLDGLSVANEGGNTNGKHRRLLEIVEAALSPLVALMAKDDVDYGTILNVHVQAAEMLAGDGSATGVKRLWAGDDGEAMAVFIAELAESLPRVGEAPTFAYADVFEKLMFGRAVRTRYGAHPRLSIWGLLEARLQHADTVILGALNEQTWPPAVESNPWMSRSMMATVGLDAPERRTGLTAHDFQQAFSAAEVYLTRAERVGGTPTVPSRWLLRLENLLDRADAKSALISHHADDLLAWAGKLDDVPRRILEPPRPMPPVSARPTSLSVTQVETLIRDPYAIYARHILGLKVLDPIDADPGAAERGTFIHDALAKFVEIYPEEIPADATRRLLDIGQTELAEHLQRPGVRAFWWPRFERIAAWFVEWQRSRFDEGWRVVLSEKFGRFSIDAIDGGFEIFAKPDRIDFRPDVGLSILDYKTGQPPSAKQVAAGLSPQLPLEAAIVVNDGFESVPREMAVQLMYVHVSGGRFPGTATPLKLDIADVTEKSLKGVQNLILKFADPSTPYLSRPRPQFENRFGDYDHLARIGAFAGARSNGK